jgi:hypothetical protein
VWFKDNSKKHLSSVVSRSIAHEQDARGAKPGGGRQVAIGRSAAGASSVQRAYLLGRNRAPNRMAYCWVTSAPKNKISEE